MKKKFKNIIPGAGLGELKFGISMDKAIQILGEPESIEKYSYTDSVEDLTETWYYKNLGINIGFNQEDNWRLTLITIKSEPYRLKKKIL